MLLAEAAAGGTEHTIPSLVWVLPFAALLLCIAVLPLIHKTEHWWHHNKNKLLVAVALAVITLGYYFMRHDGTHVHDHWLGGVLHHAGMDVHEHEGHFTTGAGLATAVGVLGNALMEYIPFISLLFSLYVISGGISVRGDIPAHPLTNVIFLAIGGVMASLIGTTGASMLLIRPLLKTNSERKHVVHTVIFFIFIVSNIGGTLLPIGDPPLFLGYLKGVPFMWTLVLWKEWAFVIVLLLVVYYFWDSVAYKKETLPDIQRDETQVRRISIGGKVNFIFLAGVVFATGTLAPGKPFLGIEGGWEPFTFCREFVQIAFVLLSLYFTPGGLRQENNFNYVAILEVACLFIGIFICMQVPIEILNAKGPELGIDSSWKFFWATGILSSCLDNAPTYVVFFETAKTLPAVGMSTVAGVAEPYLIAISIGAVFMGANTYIGNGPNFMVKSIAEHEGVKMPSFFGYMLFSGLILIPAFILVTFLFVL
ncbi:MAG TPA: sodium:proton antiporter [Phycisphaerae bacterium]|nr:sodium:proton antiporter [Phycisphaerae bacterium]HRW52032.1 sodium:proton antiporter [Phycisphaerae bacterium]